MAKKPILETKIQWGVFIGVFIPIAVGMVMFGYFALKGENTGKANQLMS